MGASLDLSSRSGDPPPRAPHFLQLTAFHFAKSTATHISFPSPPDASGPATMAKRKLDSTPDSKRDPQSKRPKVQLRDTSKQVGAHSAGPADTMSAPPASDKTGGKGKQLEGEKPGRQDGSEASGSRTATTVKQRVRKLAPPRPFPTVPASVSATGPRSAHTEGKNYICITRRTELGAYLRRCKDVFLEDGCALPKVQLMLWLNAPIFAS